MTDNSHQIPDTADELLQQWEQADKEAHSTFRSIFADATEAMENKAGELLDDTAERTMEERAELAAAFTAPLGSQPLSEVEYLAGAMGHPGYLLLRWDDYARLPAKEIGRTVLETWIVRNMLARRIGLYQDWFDEREL